MEIARNPDAGSELMLANWLLEELGQPATNATRIIVAECIRLLAKTYKLTEEAPRAAAEFILKRAEIAKLSGERVNRFWFEDQRYMPDTGSQATVGMYDPSAPQNARDEASERESYMDWMSMNEVWKKKNPWKGGGRG